MNKPLKIGLVIVAAVVGDALLLVGIGSLMTRHKPFAFADGDLPRHVAGRWDWASRAHHCDDSAEVITFSPDHRTMTIAMRPHPPADTGWSATYDILQLTPARLRGAIRGEKRLTKDGKPVVWDLVMFGPNEYRWHRTDWPSNNYTGPLDRCAKYVLKLEQHGGTG